MDGSQFDYLARRWATRRTAISGLVVGGLAGLLGLDTEAKRKRKRKRQRKHDHADAEKKPQDAVLGEKKKKKKKKCKGGTLKCGKVCVTASSDAQNCGGCGIRCGSGQACVGGVCTSTGPVTCPSGQIRCGGGCVDPTSNEAHCGGCGQQCQGDLTCLDGTCGCADGGDTQCGTSCVDTQSDRQHCGACGISCATGETCSGGRCRAASGYPCDTVADCGGNYRGVLCVDGQCACENPAEGLCSDPRQGSYANCNVCCPGGNQVCPGDKECNGLPSPSARCSCASYEQVCYYNPPHRCSQNQATDSNRCGINCIDCIEEFGPTSFCCSAGCLKACEPNTNCNLKTCDGCKTCGAGQACCRSGTSNLYGCALLENGRCPGPPA